MPNIIQFPQRYKSPSAPTTQDRHDLKATATASDLDPLVQAACDAVFWWDHKLANRLLDLHEQIISTELDSFDEFEDLGVPDEQIFSDTDFEWWK